MFYKSLLFSEIFHPYMDDTNKLSHLFKKVSEQNKYASIETDVIFDDKLRKEFSNISKDSNWSVTNWVVNEVTQSGLSASALDKNKYDKTIDKLYKLIDLAYEGNCEYFGLASGPIEEGSDTEDALKQFENTLYLVYDRIKDTDMKIIIEPLDQFAHKKFLIGTADRFAKFLNNLDDTDLVKKNKLSLCYDCAHMALNEDDFETAIPKLAKYTTKIHFSNAVLDKSNELYGDFHIPLGEPGFMNIKTASKIIDAFKKEGKNNLGIAAEVRTKNKENVWKMEEETNSFVNKLV
ncbi:hypothetical protein GCM10025886_25170 [Tetragenococcus halophilus subsp. flandriensis]|uniref:sugar phosphate isomerase/epimerase family protein n=1 Tax=Tetragenococcus halophilus TaxID=51669 RepID=UPI0023E9C6D9|nr:TIM barrel protein [Tetragenococcus halophilus]GMA09364.1 hypothetical protein GCM10025886_25170 [Tetragenococcus halophilus subsp. flandriensis]